MPEKSDGRGDRHYCADFRDKVEAFSKARGARSPTWDDVFAVAADFPPTSSVLAQQGLSVDAFQRDLRYVIYFGRPKVNGPKESFSQIEGSPYERAAQSLQKDIEAFQKQQSFAQEPGSERLTMEFVNIIKERIGSRGKMLSGNPRVSDESEAKAVLLENVVRDFIREVMELRTAERVTRDAIRTMSNLYPVETAKMKTFVDFAQRRLELITVSSQPLKEIEAFTELDSTISRETTPFRLVEFLKGHTDPFIEYLFYRNGLLAPEKYVPPVKMPHAVIVEHALDALRFAESVRGTNVDVEHLLPSLLENREVIAIIHELDKENQLGDSTESAFSDFGMLDRLWFDDERYTRSRRDFIKFNTAVCEIIGPRAEEERFRQKPTITENLKTFLNNIEKIVAEGSEEFSEARMFGEVIKMPRAQEVLMQAGFSKEKIDKWEDALKEMERKQKEIKKPGKKTKEGFKVSDRELNEAIKTYTSDRTELARIGKLDPVIGRDRELKQILTILLQRGRANPLLVGEPGVGKTVLFDGLAQLIASGNVPKQLIGAKVLLVDFNKMNSGAMYRGQFEGRFLPLVQGIVERNAQEGAAPHILCIDELHSALQAGSAQDTPGAGELLKPYLARGEIIMIGTATQADYAKYIQVDHALDRRFQSVFIDEPRVEETIAILRGLKEKFVTHHVIKIEDDLIPLIVGLTNRYLPNLFQPDKGIRVLDAAFAKSRMRGLSEVTRDIAIDTIAEEAKIGTDFLRENEGDRYLKLREELPKQVIGQDQAISEITSALIIAKAGLQDPKRPLGKFLLFGPTGVGKTETARALARLLHGTEDALIRIDMSDFQERHEASKLVGAPPGYVGYGDEGTLTGAVRRKPHSIIVLDEIEKAHPDVLRRFLPIFEEGEITDGRGQKINFRNTVILMTSNLGAEEVARAVDRSIGSDDNNFWDEVTRPIYENAVKTYLPPEFLNRLDARLIYKPLSPEIIEKLVEIEVNDISNRTLNRWNGSLRVSELVKKQLAKEGYNSEYGARYLKRTVRSAIISPLSEWLLERNSRLMKDTIIELTGVGFQFHADLILPNQS